MIQLYTRLRNWFNMQTGITQIALILIAINAAYVIGFLSMELIKVIIK